MTLPKKLLFVFVILAAFTALYDLTIGLGNSHSVSASEPTSLKGNWRQIDSGIPKAVMSAVISDNKIEITLHMEDTLGIFWTGTFDTSKNSSETFMVISEGDQDVLAKSLYGSNEKTKKFSYKNGDLSYEFSILGVSTTVHLSK